MLTRSQDTENRSMTLILYTVLIAKYLCLYYVTENNEEAETKEVL